ncbi:MAG: hypothetical protein PHE70_10500 [Tepidanaerobacteraceae bacterium]|nr:hypothetical protein [Tepidanaerobacteraceae bacterium]
MEELMNYNKNMTNIDKDIKKVRQELDKVRQVKKCTSCECFLDVIEGLHEDLQKIETQESKDTQKEIIQWLLDGNKERHGCYECEKCLPIEPCNRFNESLKGNDTSEIPKTKVLSCGCCAPKPSKTKTLD